MKKQLGLALFSLKMKLRL
ncbi:hypothetical protein Goklo_021543 [Gossypium klotzschianum]|uniref:Uncharacterized protein n=1 Tax=Gossypium klotzschianum TaxID=34286 RepID=A0A7J8UVM2_9ROSI|nr:hypothetical protein [Gossypium klotzschianum]